MTGMANPWDELEAPPTRLPRSVDNRGSESRVRSWVRVGPLPDPLPEDGYSFRWIRASTASLDDKRNVENRLIEGWEPVRAEDHPELVTRLLGRATTGNIERGGLLLCKMPVEMVQQRNAFYQATAQDRMDAEEQHYMRDSDERMKKVAENRRKVVFGQGVVR